MILFCKKSLQADLGIHSGVGAILLQGRGDHERQYVTSFVLAVSDDGSTFKYITQDGSTSSVESDAFEFDGNTDVSTVVEAALPKTVFTRFVRLYPRTYNDHISLRWDILTCRPAGQSVAPRFNKDLS